MQTSKTSGSREPFELDWTGFYKEFNLDLETDLITSSVWSLSSGTAGPDYVTTPKTKIFIEGGVIGQTIVAQNNIEIRNGEYKDSRKIFIEVT